jgi:hypothetical protein
MTQVPMTNALKGWRLTTVGIWGILAYVAAFLSLGILALRPVAVVAVMFVVVIVMTMGENLVFCAGSTIPMNLAPKDQRGGLWRSHVAAIDDGRDLRSRSRGLCPEHLRRT